jgi:hypothetical protein
MPILRPAAISYDQKECLKKVFMYLPTSGKFCYLIPIVIYSNLATLVHMALFWTYVDETFDGLELCCLGRPIATSMTETRV